MDRIKCQALVLSSVDYGESDRVVTFLTSENGKICAFAKGARKSKRRFLGALEPFTLLSIQIAQSRGALFRLDSVDVLDGFGGLRQEIETILYASYSAELARELSREKEPQPILFELLCQFLGDLASHGANTVGLMRFELAALASAGFMPRLERCVCCGIQGMEFRFDAQQGGVICAKCARGAGMRISKETIGFLAELQKKGEWPFALSESVRIETRNILSNFIWCHLGRRLRSLDLLGKI